MRFVFLRHAQVVLDIMEKDPKQKEASTAEGFEAAQLAQATSVASAVARMGARFGAGDDALARVVRARQDAVDQWQRLDARLVEAVSKPPGERNEGLKTELRTEIATLDRKISDLDRRLAVEFPDYAELVSPQPIELAETQSLLGADEALLTYLVAADHTFLLVVRRDGADLQRLDIGLKALQEAGRELCGGLDPTGISRRAN